MRREREREREKERETSYKTLREGERAERGEICSVGDRNRGNKSSRSDESINTAMTGNETW